MSKYEVRTTVFAHGDDDRDSASKKAEDDDEALFSRITPCRTLTKAVSFPGTSSAKISHFILRHSQFASLCPSWMT